MGAVQPGVVVLVRFPFSDVSASKLRPAVDWVLCQVTSNPYGDPAAVPVTPASFVSADLGRESFARPGKLFTASESLFVKTAGQLTSQSHREIVQRVVTVLQSGVR